MYFRVMEHYVLHTQKWLSSFVVGLQLCPFAAKPFQQDLIHYRVSTAKTIVDLLEDLLLELRQLKQTDTRALETTLLIHPYIGVSFEEYLEVLDHANNVLSICNLEGILQIASFHPNYQFEGTEKEAPSNFTNRSPYPMLHLLREASISKSITGYKGIEDIPNKNIAKMEALGTKAILEKWYRLFED